MKVRKIVTIGLLASIVSGGTVFVIGCGQGSSTAPQGGQITKEEQQQNNASEDAFKRQQKDEAKNQ